MKPFIFVQSNKNEKDEESVVTEYIVTLNIPKGKKGATGDKGRTGNRTSIFSEETKFIEVTEKEGPINSPKVDTFMPIAITLDGDRCFGWSTRGSNTKECGFGRIMQTVFNPKTEKFLFRTIDKNKVFGNITDGWTTTTKGMW